MTPELLAFLERADVSGWTGLPDVSPAEAGLAARAEHEWGLRGDPPARAAWFAGAPGCFEDGVRWWLDGPDAVLVVEGSLPASADGRLLSAPPLGEPALRLDAQLDVLVLTGGELVYPDRGLAVRVNPANGVLLGLVGFVPTTAEDYVRRLRPVPEVAQPLRTGRRTA